MTTTLSVAAENEARIREGYNAFMTGNLGLFHTLFTPDVQWHVPGHNMVSGTKHGVDGFIEYAGQLMALTNGTFKITLLDVSAGENTAFGLHVDTATRGARTLDARIVLVFRIVDGRVVEGWEHYHDQRAVDAFFS